MKLPEEKHRRENLPAGSIDEESCSSCVWSIRLAREILGLAISLVKKHS